MAYANHYDKTGLILHATPRQLTRALLQGERVVLQTLTVSQEMTLSLTALGMV
jgi:hypothetical protein